MSPITHSVIQDSVLHRDLHSFPTRRSSDLSGFDVPRGPRIQNPTTIGEAAQNLAEAADETGLEREVDLLTARYGDVPDRSEEHTSELQSRGHLVCRLLLAKNKDLYEVCD